MQLNGAHCHLECVSNIEVQLVVKAMHLQSFALKMNNLYYVRLMALPLHLNDIGTLLESILCKPLFFKFFYYSLNIASLLCLMNAFSDYVDICCIFGFILSLFFQIYPGILLDIGKVLKTFNIFFPTTGFCMILSVTFI